MNNLGKFCLSDLLVLFSCQDYALLFFQPCRVILSVKERLVLCELSHSQFEDLWVLTLRAAHSMAPPVKHREHIFGCSCELLRHNYSIIKWHHLVNIGDAVHIIGRSTSRNIRDRHISRSIWRHTGLCRTAVNREKPNHSALTQPPLDLEKSFERTSWMEQEEEQRTFRVTKSPLAQTAAPSLICAVFEEQIAFHKSMYSLWQQCSPCSLGWTCVTVNYNTNTKTHRFCWCQTCFDSIHLVTGPLIKIHG